MKTVAVVFGGVSTEHEVSRRSAETIMAAIPNDKYRVIPVYITKGGEWLFYDGGKENAANLQWEKYGTPVALSPDRHHHGLLRLVGDRFKVIPVDVVFPVLHGVNGEDGSIQGLCQLAGIPCVGCGVLSSAAAMDKTFTKIIVNGLKIDQAKHITINGHELEEKLEEFAKKVRYQIGYPCFIKPSRAGSSVGISCARNKKDLIAGLQKAAEVDVKIIVERGVNGREVECAVLGNDNPEASRVGEIVAGAEFYDYEAKYGDLGSKTLVPADIPNDKEEEIRTKSLEIYKALDMRGMARVDFFIEDKTNRIVFSEINTIPGFTSISMYPMLWAERGVSISELVERLITLASE